MSWFTKVGQSALLPRSFGFLLLANGLVESYFAVPNGITVYHRLTHEMWLTVVPIVGLSIVGSALGYSYLFKTCESISRAALPIYFIAKVAAHLIGFPQSGIVQLGELVHSPRASLFNNELLFETILGTCVVVLYRRSGPNIEGSDIVRKPTAAKSIIVLLLVLTLVTSVVYVSFSRFQVAVSSGLVSVHEHVVARSRLEILKPQMGVQTQKGRSSLVILLKGEDCSTCVMELLFWKATRYSASVEIIGLLPTTDGNVENLRPASSLDPLRLRFHVNYLQRDIYSEITGSGPKLVTRLLYDFEGQLIMAFKEEREGPLFKHLIQKVDSLAVNCKLNLGAL